MQQAIYFICSPYKPTSKVKGRPRLLKAELAKAEEKMLGLRPHDYDENWYFFLQCDKSS